MSGTNVFDFNWDEALPGAGTATVTVTEDAFGRVGDTPVRRFTISNGRVTAEVVEVGATLTAVRAPDRNGIIEDVVLGYDSPQEYLSGDNPQFGGTVGRVANRLPNARFTLDGKEYRLYANEGKNTLHGGQKGWHQALWHGVAHDDGVTFTFTSPDGDEGFPGAVTAQVTYRLTSDNKLVISMQAISSKPTPVSMLNHAYFNLAGHGFGSKGLYKTRISINADRYMEVDEGLVASGNMPSVDGTPLDLRTPRLMEDALKWYDYDHGFVITRGVQSSADMVFAAGAHHEPSGRTLEVYSDQPSLHFYSGGKFPNCSQPAMNGKQNAKYYKHGAFTLEPQYIPNAISNVNRFPRIVLRPGSIYKYNMAYKFGVRHA